MSTVFRSPWLDKPCKGGNHYTLAYTNPHGYIDGYAVIFICPNKECVFFEKTRTE